MQAAAQRVNVSQPALSRQIRDLEEALGGALFERRPRGVTLTRIGGELYRDARAILGMAEDALHRARQNARKQQDRIRLGLVRTASKYDFVYRALRDFRRDHGSTMIDIVRAPSPDLVRALQEEELDVALLYERQLDPRGFSQYVVHHESHILAMHANHPLAARPIIHPADLAAEPMIWLSRRNNADNHDALLQHCHLHGLEPVIAHEAESHDEQIDIIAITGGLGFTVASTQLTAPPGQLVFRPVAGFHLEIALRLVARKDVRGGAAPALLAMFRAAVEQHQQEIDEATSGWTHTPDGMRVARCAAVKAAARPI